MKFQGIKLVYRGSEIDWDATLKAFDDTYNARFAKDRAAFATDVQKYIETAGRWDPIFAQTLEEFWTKYPHARISRTTVVSMNVAALLSNGRIQVDDTTKVTAFFERFIDSNTEVAGDDGWRDAWMLRDSARGRNSQLYLNRQRTTKIPEPIIEPSDFLDESGLEASA